MNIELTPLVDVMFTLLLFFILSYQEIEIRGHEIIYPKSTKAETIIVKKDTIVIKIFKKGNIEIHNKIVDMKDVSHFLKELTQEHNKFTKVLIDSEKGVGLQRLMTLVDAVFTVDFKKVDLHTR